MRRMSMCVGFVNVIMTHFMFRSESPKNMFVGSPDSGQALISRYRCIFCIELFIYFFSIENNFFQLLKKSKLFKNQYFKISTFCEILRLFLIAKNKVWFEFDESLMVGRRSYPMVFHSVKHFIQSDAFKIHLDHFLSRQSKNNIFFFNFS